MPADEQADFARFREIWSKVRPIWPVLPDEDKRQIAYGVLALAFGDDMAAEALGMQAPSTSGTQGGSATGRIGRGGDGGTHGTLPDGCRYVSTPWYTERIC